MDAIPPALSSAPRTLRSARAEARRFGTLAGLLPALAVVAVLLLGSDEAPAACTDVPAPNVQWRRCILDGAVLTGADLSGADLRDTSFKRADLSGANLTGAEATRAKLVSTKLVGAVLDRVNLTFADLTNADLAKASLKGASLRGAKLFAARLRDADLSEAIAEGTDFLHADLSGATWIDGHTICAEGSLGRCNPGGKRAAEHAGN